MYFLSFIFLIVSFILRPQNVEAAQVSDLIRCLGQEELALHKQKLAGPLYQLNQELIVLFAGNNELILKDGLYEQICQNKDFSPSVALLEKLFTENYKIFNLDKEMIPGATSLGHHVIMNELKDRGHLIFANYLAGLQGLTKDPHCLEREIPELQYFYARIKYLEEDVDAQDLITEPAKIEAIFKKLKTFNALRKRCSAYMKKQEEKKKQKARPKAR